MSAAPEIRIAGDEAALAHVGAEVFADLVQASLAQGSPCRVALCGGRTPRALYARLAEAYGRRVPWDALELYLGDERYVPPDHPESNYRMVRATLLEPLGFPEERFVRFETERGAPETVAERYEQVLRRRFGLAAGCWPRFDLVLLGMGPDGHTASLFPAGAAMREQERVAVAEWVERLGQHRLTLTLPVFNAAARVVFIVSGAAKAPAVRAVLQERPGAGDLPAARVRPHAGRLLWLLDRAAAGLLERP